MNCAIYLEHFLPFSPGFVAPQTLGASSGVTSPGKPSLSPPPSESRCGFQLHACNLFFLLALTANYNHIVIQVCVPDF